MNLPGGTIEIFADRASWLERRRQGIGGSDIATILGLSTFSSELEVYYEKVDGTEREQTEQMAIGQDIEAWILDRWDEKTEKDGWIAEQRIIVRSDQHPFLLHSPDALLVEPWGPHQGWIGSPGAIAGIEVKNIRSDQHWDPLPEYYMAQVQHGLLCSGLDRWIVVALVGGQKIITREVEPDIEWHGRIVAAAERFWTAHIVPNVPPEPDGSESANRALERRWDTSAGKCEVDAELWATYRLKKTVAEAAEKDLHRAQQRIQAAMGDSEIATVDGKKVATWKVSTRSSVDVRRLREEEPKLAEKYQVTKPTRIFRPS